MKVISYSMILKKQANILAIMILSGTFVQAQIYSESRKIERSFPASSETRLDLSNKYGTVHVIPWTKDTVHIEIDLYAESSSNSRLEKIIRNIDFDFTETRYYIIATTRFGNRYNSFISDLLDISGNLIPSRNHVEINYTVQVPADMNINISNKYGDVYIDDMQGSVSINLSNGDLKANSLAGDASISLNFGNGIVNVLANARLNISYADIDIRQAKQLTIESKSSRIRLQETEILKTSSRRDKYTISRLGSLVGESWFSDIWLYRLDDEINYNPTYGALKIDTIPAGFSYINVSTEYADLDLAFDRQASYMLDVTRHDQVVLRVPEEYGELEVVDQDAEASRLRGLIGKDKSSASRVTIAAPKKCIITIQSR